MEWRPYPNESATYREARNALLEAEDALRGQLERVAELRRACPLCTSFLDSLNGAAPHLEQRMNVAVCARSRIDRVADFAASRGWTNLRLLSSANNGYQRDYLAEGDDGSQWPMANVFVRRHGRIHHFWGSELLFRSFPTGNTRHIDLLWPLWNALDLGPEGRGKDWYPALEYPPRPGAARR